MQCEACVADRHCQCGMQTWCECECDGTAESCPEDCACMAPLPQDWEDEA
jgi:hypothetical protein